MDISKEGADDSRDIRFISNRISPNVVSIYINEHNIVLIAGMTVNR
jgi:hypothetical protein